MVGLVEVRRRKERVAGFLELQESPGGTELAARRHTRGAWCVVPPGGSLVPSGASRLILGARRHQFF